MLIMQVLGMCNGLMFMSSRQINMLKSNPQLQGLSRDLWGYLIGSAKRRNLSWFLEDQDNHDNKSKLLFGAYFVYSRNYSKHFTIKCVG